MLQSTASFHCPTQASMCEGMWTKCPKPGIAVRSTSAAGSAFSGKGDNSRAWQ